MKVIVLAAGKGERLRPLTRNMPKSLLEIGQGMTVVESQLDHLVDCGIDEVVIVVGYKAEQIEAKLKDYSKLQVRTVFNPFFDISNNLLSVWMAHPELHEDFILVNGDDVFRSSVAADLLRSDGSIVMVIDRKDRYDEDDMKVVIEGEMVTRVSKQIALGEADGESIGMILFREAGRDRFRDKLHQMVRDPANRDMFYLSALQSLMHEGYPIRYSECAPGDWAEIDFHPDLEMIRRNIGRFSDRIKRWD